MTAAQSQRGRTREKRLCDVMAQEDWVAVRAAKGSIDVVAVRPSMFDDAGCQVRFVQVKSTRRPYERFGPEERKDLAALARIAGATAWLVHWPANGPLTWIPEDAWP